MKKEILLATLLLILPVSWAAPKDGSKRLETLNDSWDHPILNPLHPGKENVRMLQDYLKNVGQVERDADTMTREQALLLLFALHDYDKSGRLDGLEFMRLLSELVEEQAKRQPLPDLLILMVDSILETQDLNQDGLLEPSELFLGPWQDQAPVLLAAPSGEDGAVLWAPPEPDRQSAGLSDLPVQQDTIPFNMQLRIPNMLSPGWILIILAWIRSPGPELDILPRTSLCKEGFIQIAG
ncbi:UNVERIFIED_CONTAM: hypothetical protein K2H54_008606 [Gekko kuhli]